MRTTIELSANTNQVGQGSNSVSFGAGDIIDVRDLLATNGATEYLRAVPAGGLDVAMLLHGGTDAPGRRSRVVPSASSGSDGGGAGGVESLVYTPTSSTWHGFVLVNKGGSGGVTVYRDQTAPTGSSVSIDGGAANTEDTSVNLSLAANDAQTGVMDMRISVDGTLDSETFEPYATSKAVTLPGGSRHQDRHRRVPQQRGRRRCTCLRHDQPDRGAWGADRDGVHPRQRCGPVAFSAGSNGNSPITEFLAQCASTNGGVVGTLTGPASPLQVTGLTPGKSYHCRVRARNAAGLGPYGAYGATVVLPITSPAAPTLTSSTPAAGRVTVAFTPNSDGGSAITGYTAQCQSTDGGVIGTASRASSPISVTGLSLGKNYHCRVRATNAVGSGSYSPYGATVLVPATTPPAPTVTGSTPNPGRVGVAFTPNGDGGSPITGYTAQCQSTNGGVLGTASRATSPIPVTGLTSGKSYHCRVRATNAVGSGAYSAYGPTVVVP